jgi:hypothetical protein
MAWASEKVRPPEKLTRARFLRNRFILNKKALIEQRRRMSPGQGDNYE